MNSNRMALKSFGFAALSLCPLMGCVVGQAPGKGRVEHIQEPTTKGWYYLYLPEDYIAAAQQGPLTGKRWPLVVTFHGLKPFDDANGQIHEWQQEADRYGFVVIAPACKTPSFGVELPLTHILPQVLEDEALTLAAMDDVCRNVDVDPTNVLATSWSYGGYLAHYMVNRHPNRFTCLAPRQSNFSSVILNEQQTSKYRDTKIGIFYTENDLEVCRTESQEAAHWYSRQGFDVTFAVFKDLGHERRPSVAAAFFAQTCGAIAKTPPVELARMQVKSVPLPQLAALGAAGLGGAVAPIRAGESSEVAFAGPSARDSASVPVRVSPRPLPPTWTNPRPRPSASAPLEVKPVPPARTEPPPTRPRPAVEPDETLDSPLRIRASTTIGIAPLLVSFSAIVPAELRRGADFLWTVDGEPISNGVNSNGVNGQKYLGVPGAHTLEVLMTTSDGREFRATKTVTVLERMTDATGSGGK